jgi:hypothetical protein
LPTFEKLATLFISMIDWNLLFVIGSLNKKNRSGEEVRSGELYLLTHRKYRKFQKKEWENEMFFS